MHLISVDQEVIWKNMCRKERDLLQNQFDYTQHIPGMQRNILREYPMAEPAMAESSQPDAVEPLTLFPEKTPPGMAYVPMQQWGEVYDFDTAFPIGTIFPVLDFPYRGGGSCA